MRDRVLHEGFGADASQSDLDHETLENWFGSIPVQRVSIALPPDLHPNAGKFEIRVSLFLDQSRESQMALVLAGTDQVVSTFHGFRAYFGTLTNAAIKLAKEALPIISRPSSIKVISIFGTPAAVNAVS